MSELKFRAWDTQEAKWSRDFIGVGKNDTLLFYTGADRAPISIPRNSSRCKVNQYIGIKDKNGTEIYEDDILTLNYKSLGVKVAPLIVKWLFTGFILITPDDYTVTVKDDKWWLQAEGEVVGNVYENPELLP